LASVAGISGGSATLTSASLARAAGQTVNFAFTNGTVATNQIIFTAAPTFTTVGTVTYMPYATVTIAGATDFATNVAVTGGTGIQALPASSYYTGDINLVGANTPIVKLTSANITTLTTSGVT